MHPVRRTVLCDGIRAGVILSVCAIALALLGLTPALTWIPEVPLLGSAILVPIGLLGWTGWRAAARTGRLVAGPLTAALAGSIGGAAAGSAFVVAGKPALNIAVGILAGVLAGAALGMAGARAQLSTSRT
jgi:hypothetical protein